MKFGSYRRGCNSIHCSFGVSRRTRSNPLKVQHPCCLPFCVSGIYENDLAQLASRKYGMYSGSSGSGLNRAFERGRLGISSFQACTRVVEYSTTDVYVYAKTKRCVVLVKLRPLYIRHELPHVVSHRRRRPVFKFYNPKLNLKARLVFFA